MRARRQDVPVTDSMFRPLSVPNCSATRERADKGAQTERYHLSVYIKGHRDVLNNGEGLIVSWLSDTLLGMDTGQIRPRSPKTRCTEKGRHSPTTALIFFFISFGERGI